MDRMVHFDFASQHMHVLVCEHRAAYEIKSRCPWPKLTVSRTTSHATGHKCWPCVIFRPM
jgi:hypothetical protein